MKVLPKHESNVKLGDVIALLKAQGSRVYEKQESTLASTACPFFPESPTILPTSKLL